MRKLGVVALVTTLLIGSAAFAGHDHWERQPSGFDSEFSQQPIKGPRGFANSEFKNTADVKKNARDDQYVTLTGRLVNYLGHEKYEFADESGTIVVELDDDYNWSHIAKDELIQIEGKVDRDFFSVKIEVFRARAVEKLVVRPAPAQQQQPAPLPAQVPAPLPEQAPNEQTPSVMSTPIPEAR